MHIVKFPRSIEIAGEPAKRHKRRLGLLPIWFILFFSTAGTFIPTPIPQTILLSLIMAAYMWFKLDYKFNQYAVRFVAVFLGCYLFGFVISIFSGTLELFSFVNLLSSLGIFVVVATYIIESLSRNPYRLGATLDKLLFFYFFFCIFELFQYELLYEVRKFIHGQDLFSHHIRDIKMYGLARPTGLFDEPSYFGRVISLLIALHASTGFSKLRSTIWFVAFTMLIRSPMVMYAAPLLFLNFVSTTGAIQLKGTIGISKRGVWGGVALVLIFLLTVYAQQSRFLNMLSGSDGSFSLRIGLPISYIMNEWRNIFFGSGPTPLNEVQSYINGIWLVGRDWLVAEDFKTAVAPSVITFIGMGVLGTFLFSLITTHMIGGLWVVIFFYCNFFANGVNGPAMFVPLAMVFGIYISHLRYVKNSLG